MKTVVLVINIFKLQKTQIIFLKLKYISDMQSQTFKRQAGDVSFNNGMYIVLSKKC